MASAEQYSWPEGRLMVWTGTSNPYTATYVEDTTVNVVRGYANIGPTFGGTYADLLTGWRADVSVGAAFTFDKTLLKVFQSATAVHMEVYHSGINGSAGFKLWSGRVDSFSVAGQEGGLYTLAVTS